MVAEVWVMVLSHGKDGSVLNQLFPEQDLSLLCCSPLAHMTETVFYWSCLVCVSVPVHLSYLMHSQCCALKFRPVTSRETEVDRNWSGCVSYLSNEKDVLLENALSFFKIWPLSFFFSCGWVILTAVKTTARLSFAWPLVGGQVLYRTFGHT